MLKTSQRSNKIIASPIRKFLPLVNAAEKRGIKVIKLNVGEPDLEPPTSFFKAIKKYPTGKLGYAPSPGTRQHNEAWIKYYQQFGVTLKPENIIPTVGGAEAMLMSLLAVADPGDEILVFEPLYTSYKGFAAMANVKLVPITLAVENNFSLPHKSAIEKKINNKTKAIIIINPNNPTGSVLTDSEIKLLSDLALKNNLFIIADEIYREIIFTTTPSTLLTKTKIKNNLIVIDSVSKRFSCPGARSGCLISFNREILAAILKMAMIRLSTPTLEQAAIVPMLKNSQVYTTKIQKIYQERKKVLCRELSKIPGVQFHHPDGTFYLVAKLPVDNTENFIKWLLTKFQVNKKTVLLTPLAEFYITPHQGEQEIRIAYVVNTTKIKQAIKILSQALKVYPNKKPAR
ncbi:MAG: pyridoxal phosphate-dependent aminotransferase [Patescibacteria group bacterium]|nr:pyridoxal phosphate-dependent aminotransferase [Patescibacteria group bacterium]